MPTLQERKIVSPSSFGSTSRRGNQWNIGSRQHFSCDVLLQVKQLDIFSQSPHYLTKVLYLAS